MVGDRSRVGQQMHHGYRFGARTSEDSPSVRRCNGSSFKLCRFFPLLVAGFLVVLLLGAQANAKGFQRNLDSFFGTIDQDGNGEIEQGEATKFLRKLDAQMADNGETEAKEGMSELVASSQFDLSFSYGGNTISAEEMLDHLSDMMTANHVVDWVTHGLQLPQYAESFRQNAINGMDFPALIENDSEALLEDLGIKSTLHRTKITYALVRQIFGIGTTPGPARSLQCRPSRYGGIELSWETPSIMGAPPLHKYLIERWSKTFSTWTNVADTREVVFLDKNAVKLGKEYTYRVQTWGGHGPSEWVTVGGCTADVTPPASSNSVIRSDTDDAPPKQAPSSSSEQASSSSSDMWTWINSGVILTLALFSRHTFFFDATVAAWVLLRSHLKHSLRQGLESPYFIVRTVARSISLALESWCYMQHKVWALARVGADPDLAAKKRATLKSLSEPCMKSPLFDEVELEGEFFETQNFRTLSAGDLLETTTSGGSSPNGSIREIEMAENIPPFFAPASPPMEELPAVPSKRHKNRCNYEGCKVRFDRWHSLQDWWMKLNKHYCRDCQSVYCVKHTRISPHGPRGQCGLDSSCYCCACFARLPSESKRRLDEMNKLRVGPSVATSDESPLSSSSSSSSLGSSKQRFGSSSNNSITSAAAGLPASLSDDLLDFRDAVETQSGGMST